jgi:hypothetical protein
MATQTRTLEEGDVFFFFRPRVGTSEPRGGEDVQRLFMVTAPVSGRGGRARAAGKTQKGRARARSATNADRKVFRLFAVGRKTLPEIGEGESRPEECNWALNVLTSADPEDVRRELASREYETRGERPVEAARPVGEGKYELVQHGGHTELAYTLERPEDPGPAQDEFEIKDEASYIVSVKNPDVMVSGFPGGAGKPRYPKRLKEKFGDRRWIEVTDPALLDYENTQIALVGARAGDVEEELEITIDGEEETRQAAEVLRRLKSRREQVPLAPLFKGEPPETGEAERPAAGRRGQAGPRGVPAARIAKLFAGFAFPADKDELLDHARTHGDQVDNAVELIDLLAASRSLRGAPVSVTYPG